MSLRYNLIIISLIILTGFLNAGISGKVSGRVVDTESGNPLIGANVIILGTPLGAATDLNGDFFILNISPGYYNVKVMMIGYQDMIIQEVSISSDLTTKLSFSINPMVIEGEEVTVTAEKKMITKDMTATQSTISSDEIDVLPVEEFSDIVELQAGVVLGRDGGVHIRGGRSDEITYMVDGIALMDGYSGQIAGEVENNSIQELQVISGTFNAEYGRAMSGIVNIVTKDGGDQLNGSVTIYGGDYLSQDEKIFPYINNFSPSGVLNGQFSLDGPFPFTNNKIKVFLTGRYLNDNGYIFGTRVFTPSDSSSFSADNPDDWYIETTGDNIPVAMQFLNKITFHGKVSFRPTLLTKISASLMLNNVVERDWSKEGNESASENQFHDYYHFLLNPDGASKQYQKGNTVLISWDHTLSPRTFYTMNYSTFRNNWNSYVYEDSLDERYQHIMSLQNITYGNAFYTGGTDLWRNHRSTQSYIGKFDLTSQMTKTHQIKTGFEYRTQILDFIEYKLIPEKKENNIEIKPFKPTLPPRESPFHNRYTHQPSEFAVYIQDKMEFDYMIVNLGLRYDRFNPNAEIPTDFLDPGNPEMRKKATVKNQFSPRLGVAYPISERGAMHFSYGYFFQMPLLQYLYANSEFEVEIGRMKTLMGNADIFPQKTIIYEVGLQQQLTKDLAIDFTTYAKDIRDLLGTEIYQTIEGDRYARYVNSDFGNVRGIVFSLNRRHSEWLSASIDYTYQIAEGNASEPNSAFLDRLMNREPEKRLVPLDWDQRHTLNSSITLSPSTNFNFTILGKYGSGLPYTPQFLNIRKAIENSARAPMTLALDIKANYHINIKSANLSVFLKIYNLFDRRNENILYPDTGRSGYTLISRYSGLVRGYNSIDDFFNQPPHHYLPPRQMRLGITLRL